MYSNTSYFIFGFGAGNMDHYEIGAHFGTSKKINLFGVNFCILHGTTINLELR